MQTFSDPKLNQALGANGYDSMIAQIEKREGRPISDMVDVRVSVELPGASKVYAPQLADGQTTHGGGTQTKVSRAVGVAAVVVGWHPVGPGPGPAASPLRPPPPALPARTLTAHPRIGRASDVEGGR